MRRLLGQIVTLTGKDLRIEARTRQAIGLVVVLGLLIVVVLGLGLSPEQMGGGMGGGISGGGEAKGDTLTPALSLKEGEGAATSGGVASEDAASGGISGGGGDSGGGGGFAATAILWVAYLFGGVLVFEKTMAVERDDGALAGLLLAPVDRGVIFLAKLLSNLVLIAGLAAVVTPAAVLFFRFDLSAAPGSFVLVMALSILGFAAVGTLFSAAVSSTRLQGGLLAVLLFPISLPLVIASTQLLARLFRDGQAIGGLGLGIILAFDAMFLVVSWIVFELVLEP
ncbi:MAG: heme exporter protein CcmB [Phycisphaeraceae bacterium]|nr:heme exporter protein CcmB [Phycisphaeraceae bacterium]